MLRVLTFGGWMLPTNENREIIRNTIYKAIEDKKFMNRRLILFGCTLYASEILKVLSNNGIEVDCFIEQGRA